MKSFKNFISIISVLTLSLGVVWRHIKSVDRFIVKNDEDAIESLLKTDADKVKFRKEVDQLIRENGDSKVIHINNKEITISI
ncbi:hypothetical protein J5U18_13690 [Sphingobacteriaceae bacterium WQ 2009]|uniref:Uncharacterized protein n=1 Tax=Rhinopithecimicrobium faecis TaxID=2820698 RepID=A0A8T4HE43_9SPHI|nr:hypothetical protein [Sphingobacteriaceae bacterium WQ 2009]